MAYPSAIDLRALYVEQQKTQQEVASLFRCSKRTVVRLLKAYGIQVRSKGRLPGARRRQYASEQQLRELYEDRKLTCKQVGAAIGCGASHVYQLLEEHGIPIRTVGEGLRLARSQHPETFRSTIKLEGVRDVRELVGALLSLGMRPPWRKLAAVYNVTDTTIRRAAFGLSWRHV